MSKYEDFADHKMKQLKRDVDHELEHGDGEVTSYRLAYNVLNPEDYPWSEGTLEKALTALREKWKDEGKIRIIEEDSGIAEKQKWEKTEDFEIEDD
ncbi:hypothetical protein [Haloferax sp. Q22]|uniref:hypothetical protein n=1 Tax=Haloferax sp. (strain Q22) TaxID=1526048 RepID=UPI000737C968|nr:hypothetical protein [Haloferax sp. Q22]